MTGGIESATSVFACRLRLECHVNVSRHRENQGDFEALADRHRRKPTMKKVADYGIDSPFMVISEVVLGVLFLAISFLLPHAFPVYIRWVGVAIGIGFIAMAACMLLYSTYGKLAVRNTILDSISWKGDERVLDIGCGRGLLLVAAAKHVPDGSAVGVDVWNRGAIMGNSASAALETAALEGVASRVRVEEGDARQLPFLAGSFDVVLSNFVVHDLNTAHDREQMMSEALRILRPGGHLAFVDFMFTDHCVEILRRQGMNDARRTRIAGFSSWLGTVLMLSTFQMYLVTGSKEA